jgi:hypothetical protein
MLLSFQVQVAFPRKVHTTEFGYRCTSETKKITGALQKPRRFYSRISMYRPIHESFNKFMHTTDLKKTSCFRV